MLRSLKIADPAPLRSWSSHEREASQGLAGIFERRCLDEGQIELGLELIVRLVAGPSDKHAELLLSLKPFVFDLPAVGLCLSRKSQEPPFGVCEFKCFDPFGVCEVRRVADIYRESVVFALWCRRAGLNYAIIKRPDGVFVANSGAVVPGAGPSYVLFTARGV